MTALGDIKREKNKKYKEKNKEELREYAKVAYLKKSQTHAIPYKDYFTAVNRAARNRKNARLSLDQIEYGSIITLNRANSGYRQGEEDIYITEGIVIYKDKNKFVIQNAIGYRETITLNDLTSMYVKIKVKSESAHTIGEIV